ncbi:MAG: lytic transglycosylase domain-containing protein, partial [Chloroflexota bacterium]|nr:lytic transglycosylase domain-containing protein [Chloroflexota bacterium]
TLLTRTGVPLDPAIAAIWNATDGPVASDAVERDWMWGPDALATSVEYTSDSPDGVRRMVYFDKGRLDILDRSASPEAEWYVTGALLVTQMLSGRVPFAEDSVVTRTPPAIPVAGDLDQPAPLTYATLAPLASVNGWAVGTEDVPGLAAAPRVGQPFQALVYSDGTIEDASVTDSSILMTAYDTVTGHNVAAPFADWVARQPFPASWLIGLPLTEPYWHDTLLDGVPTRVLVQAFERRILTWTPGQPEGWAVESNNAGLHYREWRELTQPDDSSLVSLASFELFGEELVAAAIANGVDPYLLTALSRGVSNGNPTANQPNGGAGLLAVRADVAAALGGGSLIDPAVNAAYGAAELARWTAGGDSDTRSIVASYLAGEQVERSPDELRPLERATLDAWDDLLATHPMQFTASVEPPDDDDDDRVVPTPGPGGSLGAGQAAYYSPSYDVAWWERTMRLYDSWGTAIDGWQYDPAGYYCVHPDFKVGERLLLRANGVELTCTIGDTVASQHVSGWRSRWAVELSYPTFSALGLDRNNRVEVLRIGPVG